MRAHRPRKRFGQHFLDDAGVVDRLLAAIDPRTGERIVEIGPGLGVLTGPVLERCGRLEVIELDRDLAAGLAERLGRPPGLVVHQADALGFDFRRLAGDGPIRVIGNLPYNVSTPLIFHLLEQSDALLDLHFMLQKEVVDRLVAGPGGRQYGRLSVMAGFFCRMDHLFDVAPTAFDPPPKVDSAVIRLVPKRLSEVDRLLLPALDGVVRTSFGQRRKTLRNSLRGLIDPAQMEALGISPSARPETLGLDQFSALARALGSECETRTRSRFRSPFHNLPVGRIHRVNLVVKMALVEIAVAGGVDQVVGRANVRNYAEHVDHAAGLVFLDHAIILAPDDDRRFELLVRVLHLGRHGLRLGQGRRGRNFALLGEAQGGQGQEHQRKDEVFHGRNPEKCGQRSV